MEGLIEEQSPVRNQSELRRKAKRDTQRHGQSQQCGAGGLSFVHTCLQRFTQRSVKFVRSLNIICQTPNKNIDNWA
ncbi:MAG TPA: hypothetical protein VMN36_15740 [Verrucomicrobiales bacterium]|nr:hypothetical protein [Verrucomicrobiales bacterium]